MVFPGERLTSPTVFGINNAWCISYFGLKELGIFQHLLTSKSAVLTLGICINLYMSKCSSLLFLVPRDWGDESSGVETQPFLVCHQEGKFFLFLEHNWRFLSALALYSVVRTFLDCSCWASNINPCFHDLAAHIFRKLELRAGFPLMAEASVDAENHWGQEQGQVIVSACHPAPLNGERCCCAFVNCAFVYSFSVSGSSSS